MDPRCPAASAASEVWPISQSPREVTPTSLLATLLPFQPATLSTAQLAAVSYLAVTRGMARELAEHGITVNAVAPGRGRPDIRVGSDDATEQALAATVPLKR